MESLYWCVLMQIVVVFMSLGFIGFVTVLHIIGKVCTYCLIHLRCSIRAATSQCRRQEANIASL